MPPARVTTEMLNLALRSGASEEVQKSIEPARKMMQTFRIRRVCMKRRNIILEPLWDLEKISDERFYELSDEKFYVSLQRINNDEQKVIGLLGGQSEIMNRAKALRTQFEKVKPTLPQVNVTVRPGTVIAVDQLSGMMDSGISFLDALLGSFPLIIARMERERELQQSKNRAAFEQFLTAWKTEMQDNDRIVSQYEQISSHYANLLIQDMPSAEESLLPKIREIAAAVSVAVPIGMPQTFLNQLEPNQISDIYHLIGYFIGGLIISSIFWIVVLECASHSRE